MFPVTHSKLRPPIEGQTFVPEKYFVIRKTETAF